MVSLILRRVFGDKLETDFVVVDSIIAPFIFSALGPGRMLSKAYLSQTDRRVERHRVVFLFYNQGEHSLAQS